MRKKWTIEDDELLKSVYPDARTVDIMPLFPGRTFGALNSRAYVLKISKSAVFFASPLSGRISKENDIGINTRLTAATGGWNKGMKVSDYMSDESYERMKASHFKKGQVPHNWQPVGSERISRDGYIEIKVRDLYSGLSADNYELKQRWIYEQNHGPIPDNMNVIFKDNNRQNCNIENLELISKLENLTRNFNQDGAIVKKHFGVKDEETIQLIIDNAPEMIETQRKINKVKKQIRCRK